VRRSDFELDKDFYPIALTGAPGSGKSSAGEQLPQMIETAGIGVARYLSETATELMMAGFSLDPKFWNDPLSVSEELLRYTYEREERYYSMMRNLKSDGKPLILLIDRPLRDAETYVGRRDYLQVLARIGFDPHQVLTRYRAVLHFVTPAKKFKDQYTQENNSTRSEDSEGSIRLDDPTFNSWKGHPHHLIVEPTPTREQKVLKAFNILKRILPMASEIERKWRLEGFQEDFIPFGAAVSEIEQTYLIPDPGMPGVERRVRKEVQDGTAAYYRTWKTDTRSIIERDENNPQISLAEYEILLLEKDQTRAIIRKRRYYVRNEGRIVEINKFHDIPDLWQVEVEFPVGADCQSYRLPDWISDYAVPTDGIRAFKNSEIALALKNGTSQRLLGPISEL
jgi:CYTH domain-containing protein